MGIQFRTRGDELHFIRCPYCRNKTDDKNTFSINLRTGQFKCLRASCGAHGNMITLARDFDFSLGRDVDEYYKRKKQFRNMTNYPRPEVRTPAVEYMESRGISKAITEQYAITTQKDHDNIIVFPFFDEDGKMQFVKYRKADFDKTKDKNKEWCERDCKPILFGMDQCNAETSDTLIMTEGQIDSLSVAEAGITNAVSVPTGANGFTWIPYCWDFLLTFKTLIIFGDCEHGHITLLDEMKGHFPGTVKHVRIEDYKGHKDANEILMTEGPQAVRDAIENAVPVENPRIKRLADVTRKDWNDIPHFDSGIPTLDKITGGLYLGQLITLTGERGLGKSTLASQIGAFAIKAGYKTLFYSGELNDWQFQSWFERQIAGDEHTNAIKTKTGYTRYTVDARVQHDIVGWYQDYALLYDNRSLFDSSGDTEEESLLETIKTAIRQYGCQVIFLDNLMTAMDDDGASDIYRAQSRFVKNLAVIAKAYEVLIVLIAHPRKLAKGLTGEIANDDIAGSGDITNLADLVLAYARTNKTESATGAVRKLRVLKNRINGMTEDILLYFEDSSKRIAESMDDFDFDLGWEGGQQETFTEVLENDEIPF
jgi:archaellum biogenesis ATPase FlaH